MKSNLIYNCSEFSYIVDDEKTDKDVIQNYTISNYPKELENKVSLLQYFRKSLINESIKRNNKEVLNSIVYLKKWAKAKNAMLFMRCYELVKRTQAWFWTLQCPQPSHGFLKFHQQHT